MLLVLSINPSSCKLNSPFTKLTSLVTETKRAVLWYFWLGTSWTQYQIFRSDRNRNGGGVLLACKPHLLASRRADFEPTPDIQANFKECELLWVQIILPRNKGKLLFGICYRPPSSATGFDEALSYSINRILLCCHQFQAILLLGDFNLQIPCTSASLHERFPVTLNNHSATVLNLAESLGMSQLVSFPTRRNPNGWTSSFVMILLGLQTSMELPAWATVTTTQFILRLRVNQVIDLFGGLFTSSTR